MSAYNLPLTAQETFSLR